MAPQQFRASVTGLFPLRGGPLCGYRTDELPRKGKTCVAFVYDEPGCHEQMAVYRFKPEDLGYWHVGSRLIA